MLIFQYILTRKFTQMLKYTLAPHFVEIYLRY